MILKLDCLEVVMKIRTKEFMQNLRNSLGYTQEKMAEELGVSIRYFQKMERDGYLLGLEKFKDMLKRVDVDKGELDVLFFKTEDYKQFKEYQRIKTLAFNGHEEEAREKAKKLREDIDHYESWDKDRGKSNEKSETDKKPRKRRDKNAYIKRFLEYMDIIADDGKDVEVKLAELEALFLSISPNYTEDKLKEYRFNYNHLSIMIAMIVMMFDLGERERAIEISKDIIYSRKQGISEDYDKSKFYPTLMSNLSNQLGRMGRITESLKYCIRGLEISYKYGNLMNVDTLLHNEASSYYCQGEEDVVFLVPLIRAYHMAHLLGKKGLADLIKKDAIEGFGISESYFS